MKTANQIAIMAYSLAAIPHYGSALDYRPYMPWGTRYRGSSNMKRKVTNAQRKKLRSMQKINRRNNRRQK